MSDEKLEFSFDTDSSSSLEIVIEEEKEEAAATEMPEIDGKDIFDFDINTISDKPWLKEGADITDFFNYGFNEATWMSYCAKQRDIRENIGAPAFYFKDEWKDYKKNEFNKGEYRKNEFGRDEYNKNEYKDKNGYRKYDRNGYEMKDYKKDGEKDRHDQYRDSYRNEYRRDEYRRDEYRKDGMVKDNNYSNKDGGYHRDNGYYRNNQQNGGYRRDEYDDKQPYNKEIKNRRTDKESQAVYENRKNEYHKSRSDSFFNEKHLYRNSTDNKKQHQTEIDKNDHSKKVYKRESPERRN